MQQHPWRNACLRPQRPPGKTCKAHQPELCHLFFNGVFLDLQDNILRHALLNLLISFVGGDDDDEAQVLKKRRRKKKLSTSTLTKISSSSTDTQSGDSAPSQSFWEGHVWNWNGIRHRFYFNQQNVFTSSNDCYYPNLDKEFNREPP